MERFQQNILNFTYSYDILYNYQPTFQSLNINTNIMKILEVLILNLEVLSFPCSNCIKDINIILFAHGKKKL